MCEWRTNKAYSVALTIELVFNEISQSGEYVISSAVASPLWSERGLWPGAKSVGMAAQQNGRKISIRFQEFASNCEYGMPRPADEMEVVG